MIPERPFASRAIAGRVSLIAKTGVERTRWDRKTPALATTRGGGVRGEGAQPLSPAAAKRLAEVRAAALHDGKRHSELDPRKKLLQTCKERPDSNERSARGSGGAARKFIPWCKE